jgi:hypothetical protein
MDIGEFSQESEPGGVGGEDMKIGGHVGSSRVCGSWHYSQKASLSHDHATMRFRYVVNLVVVGCSESPQRHRFALPHVLWQSRTRRVV